MGEDEISLLLLTFSSLFSTTFYMFSQTLVMFYFIGSGTAIKKELNESKESFYLYDKVKKTKMILFPHLTVNIFLVGTAFVLIGAVDIGSVQQWFIIVCFL